MASGLVVADRFISLIAFSANLALNFAMIQRWGMYGAAWATTIANAIEALGAFTLAQRFFALFYRVPEILAGFAVAGGALWLTQLAWMLRWQGLLLVVSAVVTLGLLALIGRRDLQSALIAIRNARKREPRKRNRGGV
jgi:peptidoglycan biosynthesis protein MviN/MurJ (putative lipid II flippase)